MRLGPTTGCALCISNPRSVQGSVTDLRAWALEFYLVGDLLPVKRVAPGRASAWLLYVLIYVPVRYLEWSIMAALLGAKGSEAYRMGDAATQRWIVEGMGVSYLADLPMGCFTQRQVVFCRSGDSCVETGRHYFLNGSQPPARRPDSWWSSWTRVRRRSTVISPTAVSASPWKARGTRRAVPGRTVNRSS
jgi:hypothetical protein